MNSGFAQVQSKYPLETDNPLETSWTKCFKSFLFKFSWDWTSRVIYLMTLVMYYSDKHLKQRTLIAMYFSFFVCKSNFSFSISVGNNKILGVSELADISKFLLSLFTDQLLYIVKLQ